MSPPQQFKELTISNLKVQFATRDWRLTAVDGISFCIRQGEHLGIIGESGSGKTVTALSLLGFERGKPGIVSGEIELNGSNLLPNWSHLFPHCKTEEGIARQKQKQWRKWQRELSSRMKPVRGKRISIAFQEPKTMLDPLFTIGRQIAEAIELSGIFPFCRDHKQEAIEWLKRVEIEKPEEVVNWYPHQLAGGMLQRVVLAIALASKPGLLIVDEPTTGLDVEVGDKILLLLKKLCDQEGLTLLVISHNLSVIRRLVRKVLVMYAGQIVEALAVEALENAKHPYTQALMAAQIPEVMILRNTPLPVLEGEIPKPGAKIAGCRFHPRCPLLKKKEDSEEIDFVTRCRTQPPPLISVEGLPETFLFSTSSKFQSELDSNNLPEELRQEFQKYKTPLSSHSIVSTKAKGKRWMITDQKKLQVYVIGKVEDRLNVYPGAMVRCWNYSSYAEGQRGGHFP